MGPGARGQPFRLVAALAVLCVAGGCEPPDDGSTGSAAARASGESEPSSAVDPSSPAGDDGLSPSHRAALARAQLPSGMDADLVAAGAEVFHGDGRCHICHGTDGKGARGVGADLTDDEWWHSDGSWRAIIRQVKRGVSRESSRNVWGAEMPPRGGSSITDGQARAVAAYVWSLRLLPGEPGEPVEPEEPEEPDGS